MVAPEVAWQHAGRERKNFFNLCDKEKGRKGRDGREEKETAVVAVQRLGLQTRLANFR